MLADVFDSSLSERDRLCLFSDAGDGYSEVKRSRPDEPTEDAAPAAVPRLKARVVGARNPLEASLSSSRRYESIQVRRVGRLCDSDNHA